MKKAMFIGQAMPRMKRDPHDWPTLNAWLYSIGLTDDEITSHFFYSALVDYSPGSNGSSHRVPGRQEIENERERLKSDIETFQPELFVTIGKLSISYCLQEKNVLLKDVVGKTFVAKPYGLTTTCHVIIPLPHPSGASTWYHTKEHKILLEQALHLLRENVK